MRDRIADWALEHLDRLGEAEPELPDELDDRAQDALEPLLAIADAAGGPWPEHARAALIVLRGETPDTADDDSLGVRLLAEIRRVFDADPSTTRLPPADLMNALVALDEAPWADLRGRPLSQNTLARLLRQYDIRPHTIRVGDGTPRGYSREVFEDAWKRYLAPSSDSNRNTATSGSTKPKTSDFEPQHAESLLHPKTAVFGSTKPMLRMLRLRTQMTERRADEPP